MDFKIRLELRKNQKGHMHTNPRICTHGYEGHNPWHIVYYLTYIENIV